MFVRLFTYLGSFVYTNEPVNNALQTEQEIAASLRLTPERSEDEQPTGTAEQNSGFDSTGSGMRSTWPKAQDETFVIDRRPNAETKFIKIEPQMLLGLDDRRKIAEEISRALKGKEVNIRTVCPRITGVVNELDRPLNVLGEFKHCYINGLGSDNFYQILLCFSYESGGEQVTHPYLLGPRDKMTGAATEKLVNIVSDDHVITFPLDKDYKLNKEGLD